MQSKFLNITYIRSLAWNYLSCKIQTDDYVCFKNIAKLHSNNLQQIRLNV